MSRFIREGVNVSLRPGGNAPAAFTWDGRHYLVERLVLVWKEAANWWDGQDERTCFRVQAAVGEEAGFFDLAFDHGERSWTLTRVLD